MVKRRDVFLAASVIHRILLGVALKSDGGCPEWDTSADNNSDYLELHAWFERALALEPGDRFKDAGEALGAFNAAVAVRPTPAEVIQGLERHQGTIRSQMAFFLAYPPANILRDDSTRSMWRTNKDGKELLVKVWKRASWGDQDKDGPRILDFLDKLAELAAVEPEGCAKILGAMWLGDAIVMIQEWIDLPNVAQILKTESDRFSEGSRLQFIEALARRVEDLHALRLAHGDIKPENILVDIFAPASPVIVDLVEFSASSDGDIMTTRYSPEVGGRFERDCYAVTAIAEELLEHSDSGIIRRVRDAIEEIRSGEPPNATLLPLLDALTAKEAENEDIQPIRLISPHVEAGMILPDEGHFYLRRNARSLVMRGACEEIEIKIDADGKPFRLHKRAVEQARIRSKQRLEFGTLRANAIQIQYGPVTSLDELDSLLAREDVLAALKAPPLKAVELESSDSSQQAVEDTDLRPTEPPEDDLIEAVACGPAPNGQIDVARLWQELVEAERELITYGQVTEDSVFDKNVNRHKVQFDLLNGSFDYNRRDRVLVEREDRNSNWKPIGQLDLQRSKPGTLYLESLWIDHKTGHSLVNEGDELRFRSRMEETSLDRRQTAVRRIVSRTSRSKNLIQVLDPRTDSVPQFLADRESVEKLKQQYDLNEQQAEALSAALATRPLALVQGPPGTGKTVFIAALVHAALTSGLARNVLLASQAHEAVNNAAEAVLKLFARAGEVPSILRIGNEGVVSDRLLPFHVDRVEQLQKDRFRAEMRERLAVAAKGLGIPEQLTNMLTQIELAVRPVAMRLASLENEENLEQRREALRSTIQKQVSALCIDEFVLRESSATQIVSNLVNSCLKSVPIDIRPSADRIARFQAVAALARDFVGTVSTEQRSLETFLAGTRQIVAGTCVGLGRSALGLTSTPFDLVIVDEAARCTASELAVPIQSGAWIVLVGDHKQLEPQHPESVVEGVAQRLKASVSEVARSDFERVFETPYGAVAGQTLRRQYRMLPPIGEIVSTSFYEGRLEHGRLKPLIDSASLPNDLSRAVTWVSTSAFGERAKQADPNHRGSLTNVVEADAIVTLLKRWAEHQPFLDWIEKQNTHPHAIGIICAYSAQRDLVRRKIAQAPIHSSLRSALKVDTIDSYQGKENPIVLVSLVRNNWDGPIQGSSKTIRPGFLAKPNRINVAISRAMDRLVLVGSLTRWQEDGPMDRIANAFMQKFDEGNASLIDATDLLEHGVDTGRVNAADESVLEAGK
jgi:serine/threonine protein kinase